MITILLLSCVTSKALAKYSQEDYQPLSLLDYVDASPPTLLAGGLEKSLEQREKFIRNIQQKMMDNELFKETKEKLHKLPLEPMHFDSEDKNAEDIIEMNARQRVENLIRHPSRRAHSNLNKALQEKLPLLQNIIRREYSQRSVSNKNKTLIKNINSRIVAHQGNKQQINQRSTNKDIRRTTISDVLEYLKKRSVHPENFPLDLEFHKKLRDNAAKRLKGIDDFNPYAINDHDNEHDVEMRYLYGLPDEKIPRYSPAPDGPSTPEMPTFAPLPLNLDQAAIRKMFESADYDEARPNAQLMSYEHGDAGKAGTVRKVGNVRKVSKTGQPVHSQARRFGWD